MAHSLHFKGNTDVFCSLLCTHRSGPSRPQSDRAPLSWNNDTQVSWEGPAVAAAQPQPLLLLLAGPGSELYRDPRFRSLALGPCFPALCFKNITSHAGGFCCTTARIPDRSYICTLILLDASSLKLSQTHWPKSLRSPVWGGLKTQEFLTGSEGGGSWCFKHEKLHGHLALNFRRLTILEIYPPFRAVSVIARALGQIQVTIIMSYHHPHSCNHWMNAYWMNKHITTIIRVITYGILPICKALV